MEQEMKISDAEESDGDKRKRVQDSSVDYRGGRPLRSSTGGWKASVFIIALEFCEKLAFFGISANLILYLTKVIDLDVKTAAKNVNYWTGVATCVPLLGGFLADAYTGRYAMVISSALVYFMGLCLLTMSEYIPSLRPCEGQFCRQPRKIHEVLFFVSMYLVSLGSGGLKPCLESFGADQFDDDHPEERKKKMSFFNLWNIVLSSAILLGVTVIVYTQDYVSWGIADLILAIIMAVTIIIFYSGRSYYRYRVPEGSPLTSLLQVFVAAIRKRNLPYPASHTLLYEISSCQAPRGRLLCHTRKLRFLDKAAILEDENSLSAEKKRSPWRLATVTNVEELKLLLNTIPIWLTSVTSGVCTAQATTFFVKQGATMNRKVTANFEIPPASISAIGAIGMTISITTYEKIIVPIARKATGDERGVKILQRIGVGMVFCGLSMSVAALVERYRLRIFKTEMKQFEHFGYLPISVFLLAPQCLIIGIGEGFTVVGLQEYFYDQVPDSMRSLGIAFFLSVIGVANFLSSILITVVDHVTNAIGQSWFRKDLNSSRLDKFYWFLAGFNGLSLCTFVFLARKYTYKNVLRRVDEDQDGMELKA